MATTANEILEFSRRSMVEVQITYRRSSKSRSSSREQRNSGRTSWIPGGKVANSSNLGDIRRLKGKTLKGTSRNSIKTLNKMVKVEVGDLRHVTTNHLRSLLKQRMRDLCILLGRPRKPKRKLLKMRLHLRRSHLMTRKRYRVNLFVQFIGLHLSLLVISVCLFHLRQMEEVSHHVC